jgi:hypothetical protein
LDSALLEIVNGLIEVSKVTACVKAALDHGSRIAMAKRCGTLPIVLNDSAIHNPPRLHRGSALLCYFPQSHLLLESSYVLSHLLDKLVTLLLHLQNFFKHLRLVFVCVCHLGFSFGFRGRAMGRPSVGNHLSYQDFPTPPKRFNRMLERDDENVLCWDSYVIFHMLCSYNRRIYPDTFDYFRSRSLTCTIPRASHCPGFFVPEYFTKILTM